MHQVLAKFGPGLSTADFLKRVNDKNLLKNVMTGDETWVYGCDTEAKQHSSYWKSPASPCPR
jgi:hypothetical protein